MLQTLREHKFSVAVAGVVLVAIIYYFASDFFTSEEEVVEIEIFEDVVKQDVADEYLPVEEEEALEIMVDVKGAVKNPGVYKAELGERAIDVIERAGGVIEGANSSAINFAMKLTDEMVIYVPFEGEELEQEIIAQTTVKDDGRVNINTANESELQALPGIGSAKAQAIIEYRTSQGKFNTIEEIKNISGFGEKTFEKLKEHIRVK